MRRLLLILTLLGVAVHPARAHAEDLYSFVDSDGVIHVTNVPQDSRFHRIRQKAGSDSALHRVTIRGRSARRATRTASAAVVPSRGVAPYDESIRAAAAKYGLSPPLLKAVMQVESNFNPTAVSEKGATGLMQLMPDTARMLFVSDVYDPAQNIEGGARYLRQLHDQFGNDLELVLAAYNAGPEAVRRSGNGIPAIPETQAYVRKVLSLYQEYLKGS
jgi:soluble lytic murein transglycosylase-like protein